MCLSKGISTTFLKSVLGARCFVSLVLLRLDVSSVRITLICTITLVYFSVLPKRMQTTRPVLVKSVLMIVSPVTAKETV